MLDRLLMVAALVLFVIAAVLAFGWIGDEGVLTVLGLVAAGLACWIAAAVPWPLPPREP